MTQASPFLRPFLALVTTFALVGSALLVLAAREEPSPAPVFAAPVPIEKPLIPEPAPDKRGVEEPPVPIDNSSPLGLIGGTLDAIRRADKAALARTLACTAGGMMITEVDLHAANRQFLTRSITPMWQAIDAAWAKSEYSLQEEGETASVVFRTGGSIEYLTIELVRIGSAWFYAGT